MVFNPSLGSFQYLKRIVLKQGFFVSLALPPALLVPVIMETRAHKFMGSGSFQVMECSEFPLAVEKGCYSMFGDSL